MIISLLKALASSGAISKILKFVGTALFPLLGPAAQASASFATGRALRPLLLTVMDPAVAIPLAAFVAGIILTGNDTAGATGKQKAATEAAKFVMQTLF